MPTMLPEAPMNAIRMACAAGPDMEQPDRWMFPRRTVSAGEALYRAGDPARFI